MGDVSRQLIAMVIGATMTDAVDDLMSAAQKLSSIASVIVEEEYGDVNPNQVVEAAARCIDTIEIIVMSSVPDEAELTRWERSELNKGLRNVRKTLEQIRSQILATTEETD